MFFPWGFSQVWRCKNVFSMGFLSGLEVQKCFFHGVSLRFRGAKLNFPWGFSQVWGVFRFRVRCFPWGFSHVPGEK